MLNFVEPSSSDFEISAINLTPFMMSVCATDTSPMLEHRFDLIARLIAKTLQIVFVVYCQRLFLLYVGINMHPMKMRPINHQMRVKALIRRVVMMLTVHSKLN